MLAICYPEQHNRIAVYDISPLLTSQYIAPYTPQGNERVDNYDGVVWTAIISLALKSK